MQAWLSVEGPPDGDELTSLYRWLSQDADVRRDAKVTVVPAPSQPGDMGGGLELVNVVLSNGIALSSLVVAVVSWVGSRRSSRPVVRIEYDGVSVTIDADSPDAAKD
ncbi:hypothetical protein E1264_29630, partial [Actinomadura sp. KC216]|uniref:effector-associated constant component EACC1 n=1 Tax=Actinomadura sp. KC216 TaxID=2530370 RepID=UPI001051FF43